MLNVIACVTRQHDPRLVVLAVVVCILASVSAIGLLRRAAVAAGRVRQAWLGGAAVVFGGGVWATHFIAMLAYLPAGGLGYGGLCTGISLGLAVAGSFAAFALWLRMPIAWGTVSAGTVLGTGIGAMHFTGMSALRPVSLIAFAPAYVVAAFAAGIGFGIAALWTLRQRRWLAAAALAALAVCALHFIAMTGTTVAPLGEALRPGTQDDNAALAFAVAGIAALVLFLALLGAIVDRHLALRALAEADRRHRFANATFEGIAFLRDGVVTDANGRLCTLLRQQREALLGRPPA